MIIQTRTLNVARRRSRLLPREALVARSLDFAPYRERPTSTRQMSTRVGLLAQGGAHPSEAELERLIGTNDLVDEFYLERALLAAQPVGRISIRTPAGRERGCATGFMISPRLLLTNEHVFTSADEAAPSVVDFNYRYDIAGNPEPFYRFALRPDLFFFNDEQLDFALVSVEPLAIDSRSQLSAFGFLPLIAQSGKALLKEWMTIIQYPGGARRQFAIRENQCIEDRDPDVVWYTSDTAQGSSGSPVMNDSFQVVALHHSGVARQDKTDHLFLLKNGQKVKNLEEVDDSEVDWIANAGIRISRVCARIAEKAVEKNGHLAEFEAAKSGGDLLSLAYQNPNSKPQPINEMNPRQNPDTPSGAGTRLVLGTLVLELNSGLPAGLIPTSLASATVPSADIAPTASEPGLLQNPVAVNPTAGELEVLKRPIVDDHYETRTGFDPKFLGISTALPTVTNPKVIAPLKTGGKVIPYEHFSVVLHKTFRMPIFTATNVDGSDAAKKPEPGHTYSRKELTGLTGKFEFEEWLIDPRVDEKFQIPDEFYNKDKGSFDKGHVTRREDVCFGASFAQVQRANGDTFHLTNCTPQRAIFNQSAKSGIWGELEDFIAAQADAEKYCIFAGPIFSDTDKTFPGLEKVKIPSRFWKVVCAVKNKKLQVFPFILQQDLTGVPLEFQVDAKWKQKLVSLKQLEAEVKLVKFRKTYHTADQGK